MEEHNSEVKFELTRAFCFGEERQQMTDPQAIARSRNVPLVSSLSAYVSDFPSMIKANDSLPDAFMSFFPSLICCTTLTFDACHISEKSGVIIVKQTSV
jgi:hypothetical protein